jgi:alkylmercury lyase
VRVELLYFDGCPSHEELQPRLERLVRAAGISDPVELRRVESDEAAQAERFLGSPTVRVNGRDIEPGADQRNDFGLKCRLFRTEHGIGGVPPEGWITSALAGEPVAANGGGQGRGQVDLQHLAVAIRAARPRFGADEQPVALALYRLLAEGAPVTEAALAERCGVPAVSVAEMLDTWPEVFRDEQGRVVAFGGLSVTQTRHRFEVDGRDLYAWCAWDTLFIPELLDLTALVTSTCPTSGQTVALTVTPRGVEDATPASSVLSMRAPTDCCAGDDLVARFCQHVHFFTARDAAESWLADRADGFALSLDQGFELGRLGNHMNFRDALD